MSSQSSITPPKEVDEARFFSLLEAMYPRNWRGHGNEESFMLEEAWSCGVRVCCVRIGARYWEMRQPETMTHAQLVALVRAAA